MSHSVCTASLWSNPPTFTCRHSDKARSRCEKRNLRYNLELDAVRHPRLTELDGLRGLAALTVFFSHTVGLFPGSDSFAAQRTPLHILWDGAAAVTFFFLLSGYVLVLPFVGNKRRKIDAVGFIVKRFFRLYPAYWCALAFALLLRYITLQHNHLGMLSPWANGLWQFPVTMKLVITQFLMLVPGIETHGIDPVIWSLVIEMKISLIFPAIIFLVQRTPRIRYALFILAGLAIICPLLRSFAVLPIFTAGAYMAKYSAPLRDWIAPKSNFVKALALFVALGFYGAPTFLRLGDQWNSGDFLTAAGAAILLLLSLHWRPLSCFTTSNSVHFLGSVSYSFYLIHLPILLAVASALYPLLHSILLCAAAALILSLALSKLMYDWVEMPMVRFGREAAKLLQRKALKPALEAGSVPIE